MNLKYNIEIATTTGGESKHITRAYKRLTKNLKEQDDKRPITIGDKGGSSSAADTIPRIGEQLKLTHPMISGAKKVTKVAASYLEGKQPSTIAAASILFQIRHITPKDSVRDKDVATAAGIASSTLRSAYRVLEENSGTIQEQL